MLCFILLRVVGKGTVVLEGRAFLLLCSKEVNDALVVLFLLLSLTLALSFSLDTGRSKESRFVALLGLHALPSFRLIIIHPLEREIALFASLSDSTWAWGLLGSQEVLNWIGTSKGSNTAQRVIQSRPSVTVFALHNCA